jgi:non-ribosomal peptide synthetase component F
VDFSLDRLSNKVARGCCAWAWCPATGWILAPKSAAAVVGVYGALKAGACYVPLDPKAPAGRLGHIVRDCGAAVIVADEARASRAAALVGAVARPPGVVVAGVPGGPERDEAVVAPARAAAIVRARRGGRVVRVGSLAHARVLGTAGQD